MMPDPVQPTADTIQGPGNLRRYGSAVFRQLRWLFTWIGWHNAGVLVALLIVILAIWAFTALVGNVVAGDTLPFDEWAVRSLRRENDLSKPVGPDWLAEISRDLTALGGVAFLSLLTFVVVGYLWLRKMYGAMWLVLLATSGGVLASTLLKNVIDRPRPNVVPHLSMVYTSSFPSGHSMLAAVVYVTLGSLLGRFVPQRPLKAYFLLVGLLLTFLVGVSRVYMGVHYPTDVLAGWAAGLAWALICGLIARFLECRGAIHET